MHYEGGLLIKLLRASKITNRKETSIFKLQIYAIVYSLTQKVRFTDSLRLNIQAFMAGQGAENIYLVSMISSQRFSCFSMITFYITQNVYCRSQLINNLCTYSANVFA